MCVCVCVCLCVCLSVCPSLLVCKVGTISEYADIVFGFYGYLFLTVQLDV